MITPTRKLAKHIVSATRTGTPIRHARGVVVSSTQGTTVVTLDGGSTNVTAYNYGHVQNLPASTVVDVLVVGRKAYVVGAYGMPGTARLTGTSGRYVGRTTGAPTYASPQAGDFANDPNSHCFWEYTGSAWLMVGGFNWTGSGPGNATPILFQSEFAYVSTDASGNFSLNFSTPFPSGLLGVTATIGSTGSGDLAVQLSDTNGRDRLHFTGRIIHTTTGGGLVSSGSMAVNYMALGY